MPEFTQAEVMARAEKMFGFAPNLIKEMSRNPTVAHTYLDGVRNLAQGVLTPAEQQIVMLAVSARNGCHY